MELACALEEAVKEADLGPLKAKQQEALKAFVSGRDTFVALPTGYGKPGNYLCHFIKYV